ncbi:class I SAM-dependent methyltransferase [Cellulophaga baltica]|uniref:class I SAM-dependent methyltransferase n=1 Tax=Cellulophaga TaxID=104264 RepID=UPI001C07603C|nr:MULTISPECIES: class I SAM-dependent methyltransferase [Cellulophaga]MBU2995908.1 class I SAM-dependent methyltransferase [Cellulophaga baltica]MDO6767303.1 class I SAM-dependent methyltransferase [Cellulophaga sp. 1_MG-2023]
MKTYLKTKDFSVSNEDFDLLYDEDFEMLITNPVPQNLSSYYESENYISHTDASKNFTDRIYQKVKKINLKNKITLVQKFTDAKNILDVGAGTGDFLVVAKNFGFQVSGVEPNFKAKEKAIEKGIDLKSSLDDFENSTFDVITLWHVLEHLPNLEEQVSKLSNLLSENGVLIIAVPNFKSYDAKFYKIHWAAFDVPRHLWHFSKSSIQKLFSKTGFELVKTFPMIFDSFYVSLLSEKYKKGKKNFVLAFFVGLISNLKAMRSKEYSSLIYVLKRSEKLF